MGQAPLSPWAPSEADAADIQGIVVSGYSALKHAALVPIGIAEPQANGADGPPRNDWLLGVLRRVTDCTGPKPTTWTVGFSAGGLGALGLPEAALASFPQTFCHGMTACSERLGDTGAQDPSAWRWREDAQPAVTRPDGTPVPAAGMVVLICDVSAEGLARQLAELDAIVHASAVLTPVADPLMMQTMEVARTDPRTGIETKSRREHFGFADGLSQPILVGETDTARLGLHDVPAGDFVLGHPDAYGAPALGPVLRSDHDPGRILRASAAEGLSSLGHNGTYMVLRELDQDVAAFWRDTAAVAATMRGRDGRPVDAVSVAERIMGRSQDGDVLAPTGNGLRARHPVARNKVHGHPEPDNGFDFLDDVDGLGCPLGAHVRRGNPRNTLTPPGGNTAGARIAANRHRMLRRGRPYGPRLQGDGRADDGQRRGLAFMALVSDIERQFEFVQHTWMLSPVFADLPQERDPLLSPPGTFTVQDRPLRQRVSVGQYVTMRAGGYFFLPSLRAMRYLAGVS